MNKAASMRVVAFDAILQETQVIGRQTLLYTMELIGIFKSALAPFGDSLGTTKEHWLGQTPTNGEAFVKIQV